MLSRSPRIGLLTFALPAILVALTARGRAEPATTVKTAEAKRPAAESKSKYLRAVRDDRGRVIELRTSIVTFVPEKPQSAPLTVELVGAVHVADKAYYQELNRHFAGCDVVLYELVAPEGTRVPKGGRKDKGRSNPISAIQVGMKDLLDLQFQLDQIDYTRKNMVHADLSPDQLSKAMKDRNEGFADMFARVLGYSLAKQAQGEGGEMKMLLALFDKNRSLALKRVMAEQFEEMEGMITAIDGPKGGPLIAERNKRALDVLRRQIASGKKRIAIFYGAGHMNDMEKRLAADFGLKPQTTRWVKAWDMR